MKRLTTVLGRLLIACSLASLYLFISPLALADDVLGTKKVMVLRVYFQDYAATSRYTKAEVEGFFGELDQLWQHTSYSKINVSYVVSDLFQLPDNRSAYIDDFSDGDLSNGGKFDKVLDDAIDASPAGLDWSDIDHVMVVMAETDPAQFHRGQATKCNLNMGPGGPVKYVGCAIFSENPSDSDVAVWGRWAHEMGHAFQQAGPAHPSNYNNAFELMDANYPGQTGPFEKQANQGFPGWLPPSKYQVVSCDKGGETAALWAMEYDPTGKPNVQALKVQLTGSFYYMVSVRRRVLSDDLLPDFGIPGIPDEGVILERVNEGADPFVKVIGRGAGAGCSGAGCNRNALWKATDVFTGDGLTIEILQKFDDDNYLVAVRCNDQALQPDIMLNPWTSPPGNTWETTDIWVDSPVNGYGVYRYGSWSDLAGGTVPVGNGDDPAVGQVNRLYARVRNVGTQAATNVVVHWEITDPPGLGIAGASGWAPIGSVSSVQFPALANIPAGGTVDVYVEWTPNFALTPEQLAAGTFAFHTCVRVKMDAVAGELVLGNQDGDREQENISYFQAPSSGAPAKFKDVIHLHNPDFVKKKTFYLSYKSDVPADWHIELNDGKKSIELDPAQIVDLPIIITPGAAPQPVGKRFFTDVAAASLNLLANDLDPKDLHPEYKPLGGVQVDSRVLQRTRLHCRATINADGLIAFDGKLDGIGDFYPDTQEGLQVQVIGIDEQRRFLNFASNVVRVNRDGTFNGSFRDPNKISKQFSCLFAGTDKLMSASSGFTPFGDQPDTDKDGVPDYVDNCSLVPNPDQLDSDADGYGNACDGDLNGDRLVNSQDLGLFKRAFDPATGDGDLKAAADFNGDGKVNSLDLGLFKKLFGKPPGPSGLKQ
jgi:hypothetical protein